ncbi:MAG: DUF1697 domain-containing protein [Caldilineaceae bacterium]
MNTYIGLLRGINVGGNNKLPMKELVILLEGLGLQKVKTYIQSGNVVFQSERADRSALSQAITAAIKQQFGFAPAILLIGTDELKAAMAANPFPEGEEDHKTLHFFFLDEIPANPKLEALERLRAENERFQLINKVFYLHAPDGIGRSKLAENVGKGWGVTITARNWRTVETMLEMAAELER